MNNLDLYSNNNRYRFNHALRITSDISTSHNRYVGKAMYDLEQMMMRMINHYNKNITLFQLMLIIYPDIE